MLAYYIDSLLPTSNFTLVFIIEVIAFYCLQLVIFLRTNNKYLRLIPLIILVIDAKIGNLTYYGVIRYGLDYADCILLARKSAVVDFVILLSLGLAEITYRIVKRKNIISTRKIRPRNNN